MELQEFVGQLNRQCFMYGQDLLLSELLFSLANITRKKKTLSICPISLWQLEKNKKWHDEQGMLQV